MAEQVKSAEVTSSSEVETDFIDELYKLSGELQEGIEGAVEDGHIDYALANKAVRLILECGNVDTDKVVDVLVEFTQGHKNIEQLRLDLQDCKIE